jgi:hypothetical protein
MLWGVDELALFAAAFAGFLVALEGGFRIGRSRRHEGDEGTRTHIGALQAAVLGLLALLLGFTFAMAVSRFDTRKALVLEEANAIGTAYDRARFFPDSTREKVERLLLAYVVARLDFYESGVDSFRLNAASGAATRLANEMWSLTESALAQDPRGVITALFIQALNDVNDLREKRLVAMEDHVPETVIYLLFTVSFVALGLVAYGCGLAGRRRLLSNATFALLIALVLTTIMDIDRPRRGLIKVSQESLIRLKANLDQDVRGSSSVPGKP